MMMKYVLLGLLLGVSSMPHAWAEESSFKPTQGMVVAAQAAAAEAGCDVLQQGGNAFDAAAAVALALGVVEPGSSGIGGGGFFLLYQAKTQRLVMVDGRETSPVLAGHGEVYDHYSSVDGAASAAVPGLLAAVDHLLRHYGHLSRAQVVARAASLARNGFVAGERLQRMLQWRGSAFNPAARAIFLPADGLIRQQALAETLQRYSKFGVDDFYRGETARRLVADMKRDGGLIRLADLAAYRAIEREPVMTQWHGYRIASAALPSSGGIVLAEVLGILQHDDLASMDELARKRLLIEAMRRAYKDRNESLGDSDFVTIPKLLQPQRLQALRHSIGKRATASASLGDAPEPAGNGRDTTHFSIIDRDGNMVVATLSINYAFGSAYVSPATGILLNDEMDDFATQPGKPNAYGLVQGEANAVAPGKRMLSSMTPTMIFGPERVFLVGTPGGSRIISMVLLASMGFMLHDGEPESWVQRARYHHQFLPDEVQYEAGAFSPQALQTMEAWGYTMKQKRPYGNMQAIVCDKKSSQCQGISDHRGEGVALPEAVKR
jgi:gamma-glutamyltranspeptidase/glutathione hydrolase